MSDELLTQLAADSSPPSHTAALPGDVVTPGSVLTLTGLTALLSKMTLWAFFPQKNQTHKQANTHTHKHTNTHTHTHTHTHTNTRMHKTSSGLP